MTDPTRIVIVDGFNVLHASVLEGRDRRDWRGPAARARLIEALGRADVPAGAELVVVWDDPRPAGPTEGAVRVVHAPHADDWIVERVRSDPDPGAIVVVTADRPLGDRARTAGARLVRPHAFLPRRRRED